MQRWKVKIAYSTDNGKLLIEERKNLTKELYMK